MTEAPESAEGRFSFQVMAQDGGARVGVIRTPHGVIHTPAFMPVGSLGVVKTLAPQELRQAKVEILLGNTYHLVHHPGVEVLSHWGGLGRFMGWDGPILTDSGGFQVFSLTPTRRLSDEGVQFRSVYTGQWVMFTPEKVYEWERSIGADIIYALDVCPPYPASRAEVEEAVSLTTAWARRFLTRAGSEPQGACQALFLVVQGGVWEDLRTRSAEELIPLDPDGFGVGGVSVGEPVEEMYQVAHLMGTLLPPHKPRHLLGVGRPEDLVEAIAAGFDLFDCVLPTRNGRNGQAFTSRGILNLRQARWRMVEEPLDLDCSCVACSQLSCGYLHHLLNVGEMLGLRLISLHNVTYYQTLMDQARRAIREGNFEQWCRVVKNRWEQANEGNVNRGGGGASVRDGE